MDPPKFTVTRVSDLENGLREVELRLSDKTLAVLTDAFEHGNQCSMNATLTLPAELVPLTVGQTTGFAPTGTP